MQCERDLYSGIIISAFHASCNKTNHIFSLALSQISIETTENRSIEAERLIKVIQRVKILFFFSNKISDSIEVFNIEDLLQLIGKGNQLEYHIFTESK